MKAPAPYPLRLPRSVKAAVEKVSKQEGTTFNQFVATAVAEKLAVMDAVTFFAARRKQANLKAFDKLLSRKGGQPPQSGDEPLSS
jgi:hypothetical protein